MKQLCVILLTVFFSQALCDTFMLADCFYEDVAGNWTLATGVGGHTNTFDCSGDILPAESVVITLSYPDIAKDSKNNTGFWTMVYNKGFEVVIGGRKYFAFFNYTVTPNITVISHCHSTLNGWSHNMDSSDWACYYGRKLGSKKRDFSKISVAVEDLDQVYVKNLDYVNAINNHTKLWTATYYPEYEGMTLRDRLQRSGGLNNGHPNYPEVAPVQLKTQLLMKLMPTSMDWREMNGSNYVTPVRDQGQCGSCYAFASMAMLESRLLIASKGSLHKIFSPQDIVSCSRYSAGCNGGLPYLIAGKYAEEFGVVEEECFPYQAKDSVCDEPTNCTRYRATNYKYVGGYYGACNEQEMIAALQHGPISVAFKVTADFQQYKSGIYQHTGLTDKFNPFRPINHAVLVVGYGEENGVKYWIVKNSWGIKWGEDGFFRIIRGKNELNIESMAVMAEPVLP